MKPTISMSPCDAMSVTEACDLTGVGRTSLYEAMNSGMLRAKKLGRKTIILRSDLQKFLDSLPDWEQPRGGEK